MEPRLEAREATVARRMRSQLGVGEGVAGERHDDLGRDGDAGRLDGHEQGDGRVSAAGDEAYDKGNEFF